MVNHAPVTHTRRVRLVDVFTLEMQIYLSYRLPVTSHFYHRRATRLAEFCVSYDLAPRHLKSILDLGPVDFMEQLIFSRFDVAWSLHVETLNFFTNVFEGNVVVPWWLLSWLAVQFSKTRKALAVASREPCLQRSNVCGRARGVYGL